MNSSVPLNTALFRPKTSHPKPSPQYALNFPPYNANP